MAKFKIEGLNLNKKLKFFIENGISLTNVSLKECELIFSVSDKQKQEFIKLCNLRQIKLIELKKGSRERVLTFFKRGMIFFLCLAILIPGCYYILGNLIFKIKLYGADDNLAREVYNHLPKVGLLSPVKRTDIDIKILEEKLRANLTDISLVSVNFVGATLFVNIKQKNDTILKEKPKDIISPFDAVVEVIDLHSGTAMVEYKSIVKKGDVLVAAATIVNGEVVSLVPKADIILLATTEKRIMFYEDKEIYIETGEVFTSRQIEMFGKQIGKEKVCPFEYFKKEEIKANENLFYPLKITKTTTNYYKLKKEILHENFADKQTELEENVLNLAKKEAQNNEIISSTVNYVKLANGVYLVRAIIQFKLILE